MNLSHADSSTEDGIVRFWSSPEAHTNAFQIVLRALQIMKYGDGDARLATKSKANVENDIDARLDPQSEPHLVRLEDAKKATLRTPNGIKLS